MYKINCANIQPRASNFRHNNVQANNNYVFAGYSCLTGLLLVTNGLYSYSVMNWEITDNRAMKRLF